MNHAVSCHTTCLWLNQTQLIGYFFQRSLVIICLRPSAWVKVTSGVSTRRHPTPSAGMAAVPAQSDVPPTQPGHQVTWGEGDIKDLLYQDG